MVEPEHHSICQLSFTFIFVIDRAQVMRMATKIMPNPNPLVAIILPHMSFSVNTKHLSTKRVAQCRSSVAKEGTWERGWCPSWWIHWTIYKTWNSTSVSNFMKSFLESFSVPCYFLPRVEELRMTPESNFVTIFYLRLWRTFHVNK